jgi:hypothetical protein
VGNTRLSSKIFIGLVTALLCGASFCAHAGQDVVLLLNDSANMRNLAARLQAGRALRSFVVSHGADTRVAVVAAGTVPKLLLPLTADDAHGRQRIQAVLQQFDYRGQEPDITAGIERALYELVSNGRGDAAKSIVLFGDGVNSAGNMAAYRDQVRWLRQSLVPAAVYNHVGVFSIALGAQTGSVMLQSLATNTGGAFYAPADAAGLASALQHISAELSQRAVALAPPLPPNLKLPAPSPVPNAAPQALNFATPLTQQIPQPARMRWLWLVLVIAIMVAAAGIYAAWNTRGSKRPHKPMISPVSQGDGPRAVLYDISNPNDIRRFELGERATLLGRVAGYDPEVQYILVKEKTVGRCHAVIERRGHSFWIMDQGSINGTFVNNKRITADRALKHGDIIAIHRHEFEFMIPEYFESESTIVGAREPAAA